jgi:hypothetical protein
MDRTSLSNSFKRFSKRSCVIFSSIAKKSNDWKIRSNASRLEGKEDAFHRLRLVRKNRMRRICNTSNIRYRTRTDTTTVDQEHQRFTGDDSTVTDGSSTRLQRECSMHRIRVARSNNCINHDRRKKKDRSLFCVTKFTN